MSTLERATMWLTLAWLRVWGWVDRQMHDPAQERGDGYPDRVTFDGVELRRVSELRFPPPIGRAPNAAARRHAVTVLAKRCPTCFARRGEAHLKAECANVDRIVHELLAVSVPPSEAA